MSAGSYARFVIGIALSLAVLASYFSGGTISAVSVALALLFLLLAVLWAATKN